MERPELIGWQVTINEKGISMATLPLSKMHEIVRYMEYTEYELKKLRVADVIKNEVAVCDVCGSDDIIEAPHMGRNCNSCNPI
jgi:hypothetical protein